MYFFSHVAKKLGKGASTQKHRGRKDFFIYLKMFFILSFNWIFGICTLMIPNGTDNPWLEYVEKILVFMFIIFLGANGIVMGCIFTFNSRIYGLYKNWFRGEQNKFPRVRMRLSWKYITEYPIEYFIEYPIEYFIEYSKEYIIEYLPRNENQICHIYDISPAYQFCTSAWAPN